MDTTTTVLKKGANIHRTLPVLNMVCASCAASVQSILGSQQGVAMASVNYADSSVAVRFDPDLITPEAMQIAVRSVGYDLVLEEGQAGLAAVDARSADHYQKLLSSTLWSAGLSIPLMIISMWLPDIPKAAFWMWLLATPVLFVFGRQFFIGAYQRLLLGQANMDTLVALSTGTAYLYSVVLTLLPGFWLDRGLADHVYFESAAVVISFILLGKLLEARARNHTAADIKKLVGLQPQTATLLVAGEHSLIEVSAIRENDRLFVKPGEAVAVDGRVSSGHPFINESMVSGEPAAVQKTTGDPVFAGTLNEASAFEMVAEQVGSATVLAKIIALVKEAQGSKAPIQHLVDKIAARFVVFVILIAMVSFFCWWILGGRNGVTQGLIAFVTVLVIACPCALGLATPAAIMVGIGKAASKGMLIKDAESLQVAAKITDVVLDKTGTLTLGKPIVKDLIWLAKKPAYPGMLAALEKASQHPLAPAIIQYLGQDSALGKALDSTSLDHSELVPGQGIQGRFGNASYFVGNERMVTARGIDNGTASSVEVACFQKEHPWATLVYFMDEQQILACIALEDPLHPTAKEAVQRLQATRVKIHMLTGDNLQSATHIAQQAGITSFKSQMLPADKLTYVSQLQSKGAKVAMVGDGINDSAALAQADISIAMSHGSAVAMDVATITLMGGDLRKIPSILQLSRASNRTIKENLFWAFIYNLVGIPIAAGILYPINGFMLSPMVAGAAMALSSVSVLANSLRLKWKRV